ncbi:hypothetical protein [Corynebacterium frankenforstense]
MSFNTSAWRFSLADAARTIEGALGSGARSIADVAHTAGGVVGDAVAAVAGHENGRRAADATDDAVGRTAEGVAALGQALGRAVVDPTRLGSIALGEASGWTRLFGLRRTTRVLAPVAQSVLAAGVLSDGRTADDAGATAGAGADDDAERPAQAAAPRGPLAGALLLGAFADAQQTRRLPEEQPHDPAAKVNKAAEQAGKKPGEPGKADGPAARPVAGALALAGQHAIYSWLLFRRGARLSAPRALGYGTACAAGVGLAAAKVPVLVAPTAVAGPAVALTAALANDRSLVDVQGPGRSALRGVTRAGVGLDSPSAVAAMGLGHAGNLLLGVQAVQLLRGAFGAPSGGGFGARVVDALAREAHIFAHLLMVHGLERR